MSNGTAQSAEEALYKPYDQFILLGDSITQMSSDQSMGFGFQPALQDAYHRRLDVINRGFGGYSTAHAVKVFPKFFPKPETATVRFMTIFFGANDAAVPGHYQHVPVETYKENLKKIIQHPATVAQNPRILILTPPPVNEYQLEEFDIAKNTPHPSRTVKQTKLYAEAAREVAASLGVAVVDLWTTFMTAAGWKEGEPLIGSRDAPNNEKLQSFFTDGLHFTGDGYRLMYEEVMKTITAKWPDQAPEALEMVFPAWMEAPK